MAPPTNQLNVTLSHCVEILYAGLLHFGPPVVVVVVVTVVVVVAVVVAVGLDRIE